MRIESSVLSLSWIPSEAVTGLPKQIFEVGVTHYDDPPPDVIVGATSSRRCARRAGSGSRTSSRRGSRCATGAVVDAGYGGGGRMGLTTVSVARKSAMFEPVALPDIQHDARDPRHRGPLRADHRRAGAAARRRGHVKHPPFFQLKPPDVWTTLALTIRADGTSDFEVVGASKFPRHWVFDAEGKLAAKAGLTDFKDWYRSSAGKHTPWGDEDSEALVTAVETALERQLSSTIMRGGAEARRPHGEAGQEPRRAGRSPATSCSSCSTACCRSSSTASPSPRSAPARSSASARSSRAARARRRCTRSRSAGSPSPRADQIDRDALGELSEGHRREKPDPTAAPASVVGCGCRRPAGRARGRGAGRRRDLVVVAGRRRGSSVAARNRVRAASPSAAPRSGPLPGFGDAGGFLNILPPGQKGTLTTAELAQVQPRRPRRANPSRYPPHVADQREHVRRPQLRDRRSPTRRCRSTTRTRRSACARPTMSRACTTRRATCTVIRDKSFGVPHIFGTTRAADDVRRGLHVGRGPAADDGRAAPRRPWARSPSSSAPQGLSIDRGTIADSPYTEADLQAQIDRSTARVAEGRRIVADFHGLRRRRQRVPDAAAAKDPDHLLPAEYKVLGPDPGAVEGSPTSSRPPRTSGRSSDGAAATSSRTSAGSRP